MIPPRFAVCSEDCFCNSNFQQLHDPFPPYKFRLPSKPPPSQLVCAVHVPLFLSFFIPFSLFFSLGINSLPGVCDFLIYTLLVYNTSSFESAGHFIVRWRKHITLHSPPPSLQLQLQSRNSINTSNLVLSNGYR